jgi:flagellar biosynthesis chaperone FliJ
MPTFTYRLQPLLDQKVRLKEQAEELFAQKQKQLRLAYEKLQELRASEKALVAKKDMLRRKLLVSDRGRALSGAEIRRRREHLESVSLELEAAREAIFAQELFIDDCKEQVAAAQRHLTKCSRDVEILKKHREKLEQRFLRELERKEALELDEIGNMLYTRKAEHI